MKIILTTTIQATIQATKQATIKEKIKDVPTKFLALYYIVNGWLWLRAVATAMRHHLCSILSLGRPASNAAFDSSSHISVITATSHFLATLEQGASNASTLPFGAG
ncbi:hypothetical protein CRV24_009527 [Beauveria bassiana]|nr:hypothetical protein CRV24_009527 [Beauveria bassiana]